MAGVGMVNDTFYRNALSRQFQTNARSDPQTDIGQYNIKIISYMHYKCHRVPNFIPLCAATRCFPVAEHFETSSKRPQSDIEHYKVTCTHICVLVFWVQIPFRSTPWAALFDEQSILTPIRQMTMDTTRSKVLFREMTQPFVLFRGMTQPVPQGDFLF